MREVRLSIRGAPNLVQVVVVVREALAANPLALKAPIKSIRVVDSFLLTFVERMASEVCGELSAGITHYSSILEMFLLHATESLDMESIQRGQR